MRRAVGLALVGVGFLALGLVAIPWLIFRDVQWSRRQRWMGDEYEPPVDPWAEGEELADNAERRAA